VRGERGSVGWGTSRTATAVYALLRDIDRRLHARAIDVPPDAFLLGQPRHALIEALCRGVLARVAAVDWGTFQAIAPSLSAFGLDGYRTAVALSLGQAVDSQVTAEFMDVVDRPPAGSLLYRRVTRPTRGHVLFRSQMLLLAEGEFAVAPLEMTGLLQHHTPAAVRAILHARLLKHRADLDSTARTLLLFHTARYLGRLLPEIEAGHLARGLLRLAYYRVHHRAIARPAFERLRIVDFGARRSVVP